MAIPFFLQVRPCGLARLGCMRSILLVVRTTIVFRIEVSVSDPRPAINQKLCKRAHISAPALLVRIFASNWDLSRVNFRYLYG
jgi:hypothetical protein